MNRLDSPGIQLDGGILAPLKFGQNYSGGKLCRDLTETQTALHASQKLRVLRPLTVCLRHLGTDLCTRRPVRWRNACPTKQLHTHCPAPFFTQPIEYRHSTPNPLVSLRCPYKEDMSKFLVTFSAWMLPQLCPCWGGRQHCSCIAAASSTTHHTLSLTARLVLLRQCVASALMA